MLKIAFVITSGAAVLALTDSLIAMVTFQATLVFAEDIAAGLRWLCR